jgi:multidrug resistance efflux pump
MPPPAAAQGIVPPHSTPLSRLSAAWLSARQTQAAQANADADAPADGMLSVSRADGGQLPSLVAAAAADGKPDDGADAKAEVRAPLRGRVPRLCAQSPGGVSPVPVQMWDG